MATARLYGVAAAVVSAVLLAWVAVLSFGPENLVVPAADVRPAASNAGAGMPKGAAAEAVLAKRTDLLSEAAVANGPKSLELGSGGERLITSQANGPGGASGVATVRGWVQDQPKVPGTFLQPSKYRSGLATLPYREADVLVQPQGREFRRLHNDQVRYGGGWLIFGVCLAIALFLAARGRVQTVGGESGQSLVRFSATERAVHWMTASAFVIMALSGLVVLYGKPLLLPIMGDAAFSTLASWSAWWHMAAAVPFVLGVLAMIALWVRGNWPSRDDWQWLKRGGGLLRDDGNHPPAGRFNAGQKIVFWGVVLGGIAMLKTGLGLMFPFYGTGYAGMQAAQLLHGTIGLLMVALIIGHVYIGSVGMVGAFQAMWSGLVDRNWAKEHHSLWYKAQTGEQAKDRSHGGRQG